ncbi:helix-turn-helix transcriptional regulator [Streptomyces sp. OF3]|uniref:Helix-turn-helix transcriptional regulator n=1 Tax=Streptomyces alkaliterrae TaxID=2213162 RepID=A0A7W3WPU3_9ACTN|nr:helix-turn-helix transcriptional regulator [Streptomyces alkaliterrae]MBB1256236.1 helix-turn-helix transcriptional regulator [Streptomyces alkaliterrae]
MKQDHRTLRNSVQLTQRGLSQRQLAARCAALGNPMSNTTVSRIERGQRGCDVDDLIVIAQALRVPFPVLLHGPILQ